jgi:two-component system sensor histidine kinase AtoS
MNVEILHGVDFNLFEGEIHAIIGNHLAGKTTLGKIISGSEKLQSGSVYFKGSQIINYSIKKALELGIGLVGQKQNLILSQNPIDNIFLGNHRSFLITSKDKQRMAEEVHELCNSFDCNIPLDQPLYKLTEKEKQIVNLLRILVIKPKVIVLDEIGANMPLDELETVFKILRDLKEKGTSIIFITSNFNDIFKIADRVTILNEGYRKGTEKIEALDPLKIINLTLHPGSLGDTNEKRNFMDSYQESIIDELPIGEILVNNELEVVFANAQARKLLKLEGPRNQRSGLDRVFSFLDDEKFFNLVHAIDKGDSINFDGEKFKNLFLKIAVSPINNQSKLRMGSNIFIEDVSFDFQTREYLMQAKKAANTAVLAAGVAHEIKNPLGIIQNYIELLKLNTSDTGNLENLDAIDRELHRITSIIGNLLSFSRVQPAPFQPVRLVRLLEEVLLLLEHKLSEKDIKVTKHLGGDPIIFADENKLKQLFINLIMNSIEAVLEEGTIGLTLVSDSKKKLVNIIISDNGFGIASEIRENIFSPFFTTKVTRTNIGLGLSICQNIVELHKGAMKFSSIPGKKTAFTITFPLAIEASEENPIP